MATRKSARLDAKAHAAVVASQLVQNGTQKTMETTQGSRNLKRQKTSHEKDASNDDSVALKPNRRGINRKRGDSPFSKDVPLDILFEIFRLLEPIDLLYLSRVSKGLHGLLSSSDMVLLWKLVYGNIPEAFQPEFCLDDTNIVFYTNFLYGRHCQFCCSIHGRIYHDSALIRLCSKCAENGFLNVDGLDPSVTCLCNVSTIPKRKPANRFVLKVEYELRMKELTHAREINEVESYSSDRKANVQIRASFSDRLGIWRQGVQTIRALQLKLQRGERVIAILEKLIEEGHLGDLDFDSCDVQRMPHARKSHALTDLEWIIIRADIIDYFQDFREQQALFGMMYKLEIRVGLLESYIRQWKIHPTAWWIVTSSEPIASFIKSNLDEDLSAEDFQELKPQLSNLIASWKEETDRYLSSLIPDAGKQKNSKTNRLKHATTFFKCHHCERLISYPDILMHHCFWFGDDESVNEEDGEDGEGDVKRNVVVNTRKPRGPREPRPPKHITADMVLTRLSNSHGFGVCAEARVSFDEEAFDVARDIITTCGEDPNTVTHDSMKKARLECTRCTRVRANKGTGSTRLAMKWSMVVNHELEHKGEHTSSGPTWRKIEALEIKKKMTKWT